MDDRATCEFFPTFSPGMKTDRRLRGGEYAMLAVHLQLHRKVLGFLFGRCLITRVNVSSSVHARLRLSRGIWALGAEDASDFVVDVALGVLKLWYVNFINLLMINVKLV